MFINACLNMNVNANLFIKMSFMTKKSTKTAFNDMINVYELETDISFSVVQENQSR